MIGDTTLQSHQVRYSAAYPTGRERLSGRSAREGRFGGSARRIVLLAGDSLHCSQSRNARQKHCSATSISRPFTFCRAVEPFCKMAVRRNRVAPQVFGVAHQAAQTTSSPRRLRSAAPRTLRSESRESGICYDMFCRLIFPASPMLSFGHMGSGVCRVAHQAAQTTSSPRRLRSAAPRALRSESRESGIGCFRFGGSARKNVFVHDDIGWVVSEKAESE